MYTTRVRLNDKYSTGLTVEKARSVAEKIGIPSSRIDEVSKVLTNLYQLFLTKDATMVEINPFAEDSRGNCKTLRV
jgi:succinyl-CoA synthetase beta subunit